MEVIAGYEFNLNSIVYLLHPNNKFWEVELSGSTVSFRIGKVSGEVEEEDRVQQVEKTYANARQAKDSMRAKIEEKLIKGYYSKDAKKVQSPQDKKDKTIKVQKSKELEKKAARHFSGDYYEKGNEAIKIQVNNNKVKITRIGPDKKQKFQIRTMDSNEQAIDFCLKEEDWVKGEGYVSQNHKFIYSFIDQEDRPKDENKTKRKDNSKGNGNFLSIVDMTDEAMSHRSRNLSVTKSDRSYVQSEAGSFVSTKLGPPTSSFIKVLLAETYQEDTDPTGMIMSEKLDGVRCYWTGTVMYSRNGNRFYSPKFFTRHWPNSPLDGQLFIDRGKFSQTLSAIKKSVPIDSEWEKVKYLVFDCPSYKKPFKERIKALQQVIATLDNAYIKCHAHRECTGFPDLFEELDKVNKIQGEGLMLRHPDALYENRRSITLQKVKTFHDDQAVVLGYTEGTGRCQGMVGALQVQNSYGVKFDVGSGLTDKQRRHPPKIGIKITYKYQQFNKQSGKPRFPTFLRVFDEKI